MGKTRRCALSEVLRVAHTNSGRVTLIDDQRNFVILLEEVLCIVLVHVGRHAQAGTKKTRRDLVKVEEADLTIVKQI